MTKSNLPEGGNVEDDTGKTSMELEVESGSQEDEELFTKIGLEWDPVGPQPPPVPPSPPPLKERCGDCCTSFGVCAGPVRRAL